MKQSSTPTIYCIPAKVGSYRDAPLYPPSMCQVSRQSDIVFAFYSGFCKCAKRGRKIRRGRRKKPQETKPIFEVAYLRISRERLKRFRSIWNVEY